MRTVQAKWPEDIDAIRSIRNPVFVTEQSVPIDVEWDGRDQNCQHVLAMDDAGAVVGTGRLQPDGKIGRMAVLREARGQGIGGAILKALIDIAREQHMEEVFLHAQTQALEFYRHYGFSTYGDEFEEARIPHLAMKLLL